ncbi:uncharacterized protein EV422DRAFT_522097 [Fimicolochytrium jonesii]|uniref:uncharacterized protein n=1 Tax=Fimicolochytrium jonesii TaxID=1396493 RepID=UPI0022FEB65D|nr:uncharacterized protein EV422DRAFT_522097 [Fimicolochytrium jonesii]KAI8823726.1 hypothetical protein EV422DRAFT_522097 [Fimicolochytrium jonesii]
MTALLANPPHLPGDGRDAQTYQNMEFTTNYDVLERPWWGAPTTDSIAVQQLLNDLTELQSKVRDAAVDASMREFLDGFADYHRIMYLRECLIGDAIVPRGTTMEYLEGLMSQNDLSPHDHKRLARKATNLHAVIVSAFPTPFHPTDPSPEAFTPDLLREWHRAVGDGLIADAGSYRTRMLGVSGYDEFRISHPAASFGGARTAVSVCSGLPCHPQRTA